MPRRLRKPPTDSPDEPYFSDFARIPIFLPSLKNQKDIVDTLGSIEKSIEKAKLDLQATRTEKLAYVQQLLDENASDKASDSFSKVRLGSLGKFLRGVAYAPSDLRSSDSPDAVPLLRAHNIKDAATNTESLAYVARSVVSESQILRRNDVLICMSNGSKKLVGKAASVTLDPGTYTFGAFCAAFRPNGKCDYRLVPHLFQSKAFRRSVATQLAGSSINNLRSTDLQAVEVGIFRDPAVQHRIAQVFDSFDSMCKVKAQDLSLLEKLRNGVLARMFSSGR